MIAVIFAKRSGRFPGKHMHKIGGITLIDHVARKMHDSGLFERVVIFTKDLTVRSGFAEVVHDESKDTLIFSIIEAIDLFGEIFAFAGDMPLISMDIVKEMLEKYHGLPVCPVLEGGRLEPLHAIYNRSVKGKMQEYADSGKRSIQGFVRSADFELLEIDDERPFYNLNYPEDVDEVARSLENNRDT